MSILGIVGIVLALGVLIYLGYKGWDVAYVAILSVIIIAVFNAQNITDAFVGTFMKGAANIFTGLYPIFITGAIFGAIFSCAGAGDAIARGIANVFARKNTAGNDATRGAWIVTVVSAIVFSLMNYAGVDAMIGLFAMYPILVGLLRTYDLPRRALPALLMSCYGIANGPGAVQSKQVLAMQLLGTSSTAGFVPGLVGMLIIIAISVPYVAFFIIKAKKNGEVFHEYEGDMRFADNQETKCPNFFVALIPLVVIFVLFNVFKWNNAIAVLAGTVVTFILCFPQIKANAPHNSVAEFLKTALNRGVVSSSKVTIACISVVGFGTAVTSTDTFIAIANKLTSVKVGGYFVFATAICLLVGLMANSIGGIQIGLPILANPFIEKGLSAAGMHRIAMYAASTFDSLPISMFVIMCHDVSGVKLKDGYKPVFVISVLVPLICTYIVALMYTIYPNWA